jgi:TolB-like protein/class 3 adenylate cyclase
VAEERAERRLTTILAADVVGYSRLMAADETGTLRSLKALRREIFELKTAEYRGRVVKLMGDGTLMEFGSVVDAVAFAVDVQRAMALRNADVPDDQCIAYRIGINIGDIIVEGDDIYGDGVNVAARLEGLAEPGGICVSRNVVDQVKGKVEFGFEDLGEQTVKNIAGPIQTFRVVPVSPAGPAIRFKSHSGRKRRSVLAAAGLMIAALAGLVLWQRPWKPDVEPASIEAMAFPLPDKPSIAVLPFDNLSDDQTQEYFADGMTEDLITDLSKISGLFVIARNSSFSYKGQQVKVSQVAEDLGVRYVLEGSVRRAGVQVRINAQLIDATTGGHLWAERYDGSLEDIFALQDKITQQIVAALAVELTGEELALKAYRDTVNVEAHDAFLQGWEYYRRLTPRDFVKAIPYFERAIELDPDYGRAYSALALIYWRSVQQGYSWTRIVSPDPSDFLSFTTARTNAERYTTQALKNPTPLAYQVSSAILWTYRQFDDAVADARKAVSLDPNDPDGYVALAWALICKGEPVEAFSACERAMRLDPDHPQDYLYVLGMAQLSLGNFDDALIALQGAQDWSPEYHGLNAPLAATYAHLDRGQEAREALSKYFEKWTFSATTLDRVIGWWPYRREEDLRRLGNGLIKAGFGTQKELDNYISLLSSGGTLQ